MTFGQLLESYRLGEEMSQKDFAHELGITASCLCDLEKGRKVPSINRVIKMANILGVSKKLWVQVAIQDLLRREDLEYSVKLEKAS